MGGPRGMLIMDWIKEENKRRREHFQRDKEEEDTEEEEEHRMMFEEEEEWLERWHVISQKTRKQQRNTGKRPGGSNTTGRVEYQETVWGEMLRNPNLNIPGSPIRKTFMRRF